RRAAPEGAGVPGAARPEVVGRSPRLYLDEDVRPRTRTKPSALPRGARSRIRWIPGMPAGRALLLFSADGMSLLPGRERLRDIASSTEGSLREVPYAFLLAALALEKRDVVAVLKRRQTEKQVVFEAGTPIHCI